MGFYFVSTSGWASKKIKTDPLQAKLILIKRLIGQLKFSNIRNIKRQNDFIKFYGDIFRFIWNGFNRFNPVSKGYFYVYNIDKFLIVKFRIWYWEFFVYALLFSTVAFFGVFPNLLLRLFYLFLVWAIYLINIFLANFRIKKLLKDLIKDL